MTVLLETQRLIIKLTSTDDFEDILELRSDPEVQKYTQKSPATRQDVQKFLDMVIPYQEKHGFGMGSVFHKDTGLFLGQAGIFHIGHYDLQREIEIGYRFHKKYWGQGYATEISEALVIWGFQNIDIDTIVAFTETANRDSRRVLEKIGFKHLGLQDCYYGKVEKYEIYR